MFRLLGTKFEVSEQQLQRAPESLLAEIAKLTPAPDYFSGEVPDYITVSSWPKPHLGVFEVCSEQALISCTIQHVTRHSRIAVHSSPNNNTNMAVLPAGTPQAKPRCLRRKPQLQHGFWPLSGVPCRAWLAA